MNSAIYLRVALDTPLASLFDYRFDPGVLPPEQQVLPQPGQLVLVPFGRQQVAAMVLEVLQETDVPPEKIRDVLATRSQLPALNPEWLALAGFAAAYYHRPVGEVMLPALPKNLKALKTVALDKALKKISKQPAQPVWQVSSAPVLNEEQAAVVDAVCQGNGFATHLLFGVTGSGKTEVYLQSAARLLAQEPDAQILILVPEINLTPQLENHLRARFPGMPVATLHSGLSEGERTLHWLNAHLGHARILLGTRLAVLASLPKLRLIIIDEEHDVSYKQQEGLRYSARDLAIWRARQRAIPVLLGSATPSLESWYAAQQGRYQLRTLTKRAVEDATLPLIRIVNLERERPSDGLSPRVIAAITKRLEAGEQSLLFLNRRGYAPVLSCEACGWVSPCPRCSANLVLHKRDHRLRCHHCGLEQRIPHTCPDCGNIDLQPLGRGTQRLEEVLATLFPDARVFRIDADSTRLKGSAEAAFDKVHDGEVDILVGTQMVAKGHDFKRLTMVTALNPDAALFSQDYRASERLFAQLMQVAGRAGRAGGSLTPAEVLVQTRYPDHPLYHALMRHDYPGFAKDILLERQQAGFPPYVYQALLRAEATELAQAVAFLKDASELLSHPQVMVHDPVPMTLTRLANRERAQLLIESAARPALQAFLREWLPALRTLRSRVKWSVEVDPVDI